MKEIFGTVLRSVGLTLGGLLLGQGLLPDGTTPEMVGGFVVTAGLALWGIIQKRVAARKLEKAIAAPAGQAE